MRLRFQENPWDLHTAAAYIATTTVVLLFLGVDEFLAAIFVLQGVGYMVVAALFPKNTTIDWMERVPLSLSVGIALVPLCGLLGDLATGRVGSPAVSVITTILSLCVGSVSYLRRMRVAKEQRLSLAVELPLSNWRKSGLFDRALTVGLASGLFAAGGTLAYVALMPTTGGAFTEFYILGPGGNVSGYPETLNASEHGTVILGIVNHEAASVTYTVRVDLVGVRTVVNATSGYNETVEVNRTTWSTINVTLADRQNWTQPYTFQINYTGPWKVQFLLFKAGDLSSTYRELHLYLRIT